MKIEEKVKYFINEHHLLDKDKKYIVALSGGADSVCLLLLLKKLHYQIEAAHCNFRLRGDESYRDEEFCVNLCHALQIPLHRIHFETKEYAHLHKISIEMAARDLRYSYFENLRKDIQAEGICIAHHQEDCVETILINLIRGTGIQGMRGILPQNGHIIRPLLSIKRKDIEYYLQENRQNYVTDSTNLINDVQRNKIRLDIMPMLKQLNAGVVDNIYSTAQHLTEANCIINDAIKKYLTQHSIFSENEDFGLHSGYKKIRTESIENFSSPEYLLYYILSNYDFSGSQIEQIYKNLHGKSGKVWKSNSYELLIDRENLIIKRRTEILDKTIKIPEPGTYVFDETSKVIINNIPIYKGFQPSKTAQIATLDADKVKMPITIRLAKLGDRFKPFGMKGTKLISDLLTDIKKNLFEKQQQLVIEDAKGNIIWVVGIRTDDRFKIDSKTTNILKVEII